MNSAEILFVVSCSGRALSKELGGRHCLSDCLVENKHGFLEEWPM